VRTRLYFKHLGTSCAKLNIFGRLGARGIGLPGIAMRFFSDLKKKKAAADDLVPSKRSNSVALSAIPTPEAAK
jgi:hypothetical protein